MPGQADLQTQVDQLTAQVQALQARVAVLERHLDEVTGLHYFGTQTGPTNTGQ